MQYAPGFNSYCVVESIHVILTLEQNVSTMFGAPEYIRKKKTQPSASLNHECTFEHFSSGRQRSERKLSRIDLVS